MVGGKLATPGNSTMKKWIFFIFNTFCKLILNLTLFIFFSKTNTFGRAYFIGAAKRLCRALHGGAARGVTW